MSTTETIDVFDTRTHSKSCGQTAIASAVVVMIALAIWFLDANVSEDVSHAAIAAVFAVVIALFTFEVLTIGTRGSLTMSWRVAVAIALGSIPLVLTTADVLLGFGAEVSLHHEGVGDSYVEDRVRVLTGSAAVVATALPLLLVVACIAAGKLFKMSPLANAVVSVSFALYGTAAFGLVLVAILWTGSSPFRFLVFGVLVVLIALVLVSDVSVYYLDRDFGNRKLAPRISLSKTWGGFIGAMTVSGLVLLIALLPLILAVTLLPFLWGPPAGVHIALLYCGIVFILGASIAAVGTAGELFASWFKRHAGTELSGGLIPGNGGMLDRLDSLIPNLAIFSILLFGLLRPL